MNLTVIHLSLSPYKHGALESLGLNLAHVPNGITLYDSKSSPYGSGPQLISIKCKGILISI